MSEQPTDPSVSPQEPKIPSPRGIGPGPYATDNPIARLIRWIRQLFGGSGPTKPPTDLQK